jgi:hypothetical protein
VTTIASATGAGPAENAIEDEVEELVRQYADVEAAEEGGITFYLLPNVAMKPGRTPARVDLLLCPVARDGYESRLFLSERVHGGPQQNWNGHIRILERNWVAVSWRTPKGLRMAQMVAHHLGAF